MENASKALLMAGAILIGIIVLGAFSFLFIRASDFASSYEEDIAEQEVIEFNVAFEEYLGRKNLTGHDVLTVINLANDYNERVSLDAITVVIDNRIVNNLDLTTILNEDIPPRGDEPGQKAVYSCDNILYDNGTKRVRAVEFSKKIIEWQY